MNEKPYSYYISPEDIQTKDKLTLYNEYLIALLTWEADGNLVKQAEYIALLDSTYDSMSSEDKAIALKNKQRILRGSHEHNGTTVQEGSETNVPVGDEH